MIEDYLLNNEEVLHMAFTGSLLLVSFCLGALLGAWLISRRHEKIYKHIFNEVLTKEQLNDITYY